MDNNRSIVAWFVNNPVAANLLLIAVIVVGLLSLSSLRKEAFPSLDPSRLTVSIKFDSGDPIQAEEGIAIKVENALDLVPGIKRITSVSDGRGSEITVEKQSDYDLDVLLADVKTKVDAIFNFPEEAERPVINKARQREHAIWIQLYGDVDRVQLQSLTERLRDDLRRQPAIRDLVIQAKAEPIISVEVNEAKLQAYGLTFSDVSDVINAESGAALTTSLRYKDKSVRLKVTDQAYDLEGFSQIPFLTSTDGTVIRLGDVAKVSNSFEENIFVLSRYNQQNATAIQILVDERSDVVDIVKQANEVVQQWKTSSIMPDTLSIDTWHDQSTLITERLTLLVTNALTGIALVFFVLAIFLNLRVAFWVAVGLPFVFLGTLYFMTDTFFDLTINELTTLGFIMALGIVVDDAVVVGESIYSTRKNEGDSIASTIKGTMKVATPTIFGVLTTIVAFISLANIAGYGGQIYAQFGTVVVICLLLSLLESKLILPSHLANMSTRDEGKQSWWSKIQEMANSLLGKFNERIYTPIIRLALTWRYAIVLLFVVLFIFVISMLFTGAVKVAFFPAIYGDTVNAQIKMYNDASYGQLQQNLLVSEQAALEVDQLLQQQNSIQESGIGSLQVIATGDNDGSIRIELNNSAQYTISEFAERWQQSIGQLEGAKKIKVLSTLEVIDSFKVELKALDSDVLQSAGDELTAYLQTVNGVSGIDHNLDLGEPTYRFVLTEQGRALGMDSSSLATQVLQSFGGAIVQRFQREDDEVKVRVRYPADDRQTIGDIERANIRTPDGTVVPLMSIAVVETVYQPQEISRINGERAVFISATVDKNVLSPNQLVKQVKSDVIGGLSLKYNDLRISFAGEAEEQAETTSSMTSMFALTILVIYSLLAVPLKSYAQPLIIMMVIPFGIIGAILGHWFSDLTLSILSLNGIFALSGVVVNDGILLVSKYNALRKAQIANPQDAIIGACNGRLRAIILTSFTTFAGLLPLLSETSLQAQFLIPAAASLGYGILFATLITLVLIPAMLMIKHDVTDAIEYIKLRYSHGVKPIRLEG
ncbi:multidrug efflux pump subunit AcrB [Alteromonas sp. 76-1]|jgi:multidrug efflux pump subunit AcrB|uniref:efflux RND transporter permease subunit n=1 Tax=Alteromonas sp. 76-1 TaxID=2358187 RepID=UPI000FD15FDF|nr:efflux RND transporter permease subunit [Alteromonas sp. 76-1]VEL95359.1 multidrug efflux pump subunit AcrB [Alteromonas sp. 76-1]